MQHAWQVTEPVDAVERVDSVLAAHCAQDDRRMLLVTRDGELCLLDLEALRVVARVSLAIGEAVLFDARFVDDDGLWLGAHVGAAFEASPPLCVWRIALGASGAIQVERASREIEVAPREAASSADASVVLARSAMHGGCVALAVPRDARASRASRFELRDEASGAMLFPPHGASPWTLCVHPRGTMVALCNDERVLLFDAHTRAMVAEHPIAASLIEWTSDGLSLLMLSRDRAWVLLALGPCGLEERWRAPSTLAPGAEFAATVAPAGDRLIVAATGHLLMHDLRDGSVVRVQHNFFARTPASPCFVTERACCIGNTSTLSLFDVDARRFRPWLTVQDATLMISGACAFGAIAVREGAYAVLRPGGDCVVTELDDLVTPLTIVARNAAHFAVFEGGAGVAMVRVDGVSLGVAVFDPLAELEWIESLAMSADGATLAALTTHGRLWLARFHGDPRRLALEG